MGRLAALVTIAAALIASVALVHAGHEAVDAAVDEAVDEAAADALAVHDYLLSCGGCHKLDGTGSARVPSLRGIDRLLARDGGRDYVLRVPGVAHAPLSDDRLAALLDWVFAEFAGGTPTPGFTAAEVGAARAHPLVDPKAARAALD